MLECLASSLRANLLLSALQQMRVRKESQQQHTVEEYIAPVLKCSHDQHSVLEYIAPAPGVCAAPALCREVISPAPGVYTAPALHREGHCAFANGVRSISTPPWGVHCAGVDYGKKCTVWARPQIATAAQRSVLLVWVPLICQVGRVNLDRQKMCFHRLDSDAAGPTQEEPICT